MHLVRFQCHAFRCLAHVDFAPGPSINVIRGDNAQGKTSLLEAILYAATSKSHRCNTEGELVQHGQAGFRLHLEAQRRSREIVLDAVYWEGAKRFKVNGVPQGRVSDILGKVNLVLFTPEDVALVRGNASGRRRFLDMELSQISGPYLHALQRYRQAIRQRNELLRKPPVDRALLEVWDVQLAEYGMALMAERGAFLTDAAGFAAQAHERIAPGERLELHYLPDVAERENLAAVLEKSMPADIRRGMTSRGPHRDDFEFVINGQPARQFASQGQQKSASLSLKLAETELIRARTGEPPVLMLDEVLAELDRNRAQQLLGAVGPDVQCILTTTELDDRRGVLDVPCSQFLMKAGCLETQ